MSDAPILPASLSPSETETISEPCVYCGQVTTTRGHIEELAYRAKRFNMTFRRTRNAFHKPKKQRACGKYPHMHLTW